MQGASNEVDVIDGVQVNVLQGLVEGMSVGDNNPSDHQDDENCQLGAVGGIHLPESARALSAFRRPRERQ